MAGVDDNSTAKIVRDLLVIAKVAMPPKLYAEDPRVTRATALLKSLEAGLSSSRTPNLASRPPASDVTAMAVRRPVEESRDGISFVVDLPWDLVEALGKALEVDAMPLDPSDALTFIARDWFTAHGYTGLLPGADEASN